MRIFLVRHGMSQSNADWEVNTRVADHAIELTEEGKKQARKAGEFLAQHFIDSVPSFAEKAPPIVPFPQIRLWLSPYTRTRQTADMIESTCLVPDFSDREDFKGIGMLGAFKERVGSSWFKDRREHLLLAEQQFGIFDGLSDAERESRYPDFQAYYEKCKAYEGKLWPKMPLGESRFEVCQRIHQAFGSFHRDAERHGIENIVVVTHGTAIRAFLMMWLHLPYEWMHQEPNPKNCSIRLIDGHEDKGYIFEGFENPPGYKHKALKETEE